MNGRNCGESRIVEPVLTQHIEDGAHLAAQRMAAVTAPHFSLGDLGELDQRLLGHLDAIKIGGVDALRLFPDVLAHRMPGDTYFEAVVALRLGASDAIDRLVNRSVSDPSLQAELSAAGEWVACMHEPEVDVGLLARLYPFADSAQTDGETASRLVSSSNCEQGEMQAFLVGRTLQGLGKRRAVGALQQISSSVGQAERRYWYAWANALQPALDASLLGSMGELPSDAHWLDHVQLVARRQAPGEALETLAAVVPGPPERWRCVIMGLLGDVRAMPTLFQCMADNSLARVAGEAFSLITGVDLAYEDMDADWPEGFSAGPTEDPDDESVALDPDEDLPWPDVREVSRWWSANEHAFPGGQRYLCGRPVSDAQCRQVLRDGYQRQRMAAAYELALMNPEEPLFDCAAPAFRQRERLGLPAVR